MPWNIEVLKFAVSMPQAQVVQAVAASLGLEDEEIRQVMLLMDGERIALQVSSITSDTFATYGVPPGSMLVAQATTNGLLFGGMKAEIEKMLDTRLDAYLKDPKSSLDLSGMKFGDGGARRLAEVLPKWWVFFLV
jgi:hypothetical protein